LLKKNKPIPDKNIEPEHNDRIRTLENEAASVSCEYKLNDYDLQELIFDKYVQKFPDTHYVDITRMVRVKVGSDPRNYLVFFTEEEVTDSIKFKKRKFNRRRIGFHPIVTGEATYDDYGQLTGYEIGTPNTSFDKEFDPEFVKKKIAECRSGPRELLIGRGAIRGETMLSDPPMTCPNLENFLYGDFDLLMEAARLHYLKSDPSGYQEFLNIRAANLEHALPTISTTKKDNATKEK
jgi:hypothetical protein